MYTILIIQLSCRTLLPKTPFKSPVFFSYYFTNLLMHTSATFTSVYAFVCWIGSIVSLVIFLIWAFSTDEILYSWNITYYPSRYYALAIPAYLLVAYVLGSVMYVAANFAMTNDPEDIANISDEHSLRAPKGHVRFTSHDGIPEVGDMDPLHVSRVLMRISDS